MKQIYSMKLTQLCFPIPTCEYWHAKNTYPLDHFCHMAMDLNKNIRMILKGTSMNGQVAFKLRNGWDFNQLDLVFVSQINKAEDMQLVADTLAKWLPDWYTTVTFHYPWGKKIAKIVNNFDNVPNIGRNTRNKS